MYKSPIEIIYSEVKDCLEGEIYKSVQSLGIRVEKEQLIKTLKYDRQMYEKGYKDGIESKESCIGCKNYGVVPYNFPCNACRRNTTDLYSEI